MALVLYALTAAALLALAHRCVTPLTRRAALILFLLPFALAGFALLTNRVFAPVDLAYEHVPLNWMKQQYGIERASTGLHTDVYLEFIPWRKATQWSLARGEWGLWNPFTFAGEPHLGAEQAAVTWPITWIACLLPPALSFTFTAAITLLIAALTAFLFAREFGCREAAALVAAAGWAFASSLVLFLLVAMGAVWAWAPLVFAGVCRVVRQPGARAAAILALAFTAILAAGHPESTLYVVFTGVLYGVFELLQHRRNALRAIAMTIAATLIALLLSAIHLLPFLEALPHSVEYAHRQILAEHSEPHAIPGEHVLARIATTFFPYLHGRTWKLASEAMPSHTTGAVGSILLALAVYAVWRVRSRETWFFGALVVLCLIVGAEWKPVTLLFGNLPLFDIALNDRIVTAAALFLVILAALGVEELSRRGTDRAATWTLAATLLVISIGNAILVRSNVVSHDEVFFGRFVVLAEVALLCVALIATRLPRLTIPLLLAAIVAQRALSVGDIYKSFTQRQAYPPIPILEPARNAKTPFRIVGHGLAFPPATSTMYELEDIRGYSAMTFRRLRETYALWSYEQSVWFNRVDDLTKPFLSFLNVRYAITWDRGAPPDGWREVARQQGSVLLENTRVLERAFIPRNVSLVNASEFKLKDMLLATDFADRAWVEVDVKPYDRANGPGTLTLRTTKLGYELDADMQGDGWIVTSITAWPGWRAYVDGRRVKTQIANHAFVSVYVPQGRHRVRLTYRPRGWLVGRAITGITAIALVIAWSLHRRKSLLQRRNPSLAALPLGE